VRAADLDLDLDVFAGPFDLLLTLVLREEVDLLEVDLADVVVTYVDLLEAKGELDLELATEFLVLIAALLELKSRLMLPGEEQELLDLEPGEAAEELLARLLDDQSGYRFRSAPLPAALRRTTLAESEAVYDPALLGRALGGLLRMPPEISLHHVTIQRVTVIERLRHLRALLRRGRFSFDEAVARADRVTVAVTIWALLELYKRGEATWEQDEPFADVTVEALAERPWPDLAGPATGAEPIRTPHVEPDAEEHAVAATEPVEVPA
jgi:segregation and condensation protein A